MQLLAPVGEQNARWSSSVAGEAAAPSGSSLAADFQHPIDSRFRRNDPLAYPNDGEIAPLSCFINLVATDPEEGRDFIKAIGMPRYLIRNGHNLTPLVVYGHYRSHIKWVCRRRKRKVVDNHRHSLLSSPNRAEHLA